MKLNKIFMLGLMATAALFTACSSDDHDYEWGKPAGTNDVTFSSAENMVLDFTATSFDIELSRPDSISQNALTVPVKCIEKPDFLTLPSEVTFAAGESTATLNVTIGEGMEAFTEYRLKLTIPEDYTNPYSQQNGVPIANIKFLKEDFQLYATGTFHEAVYYEDAWEVEIEYSPMLELYRIKDAIIEGTHWYFKWSGPDAEEQSFMFTDSEGNKATCTIGTTKYYGFFSGIVNSKYGNVYVTVLGGNFIGYDPDGPEFDFPVSYRVSAGSFGSAYEWIDGLEFVNK